MSRVKYIVPLMGVVVLLAGLTLLPIEAQTPEDSPNGVAGFAGNQVEPDVAGATIGGGGQQGFPNLVRRSFGTVSGGSGNEAAGEAAVGGGVNNTAQGFRSVIGGGSANFTGSGSAVIAGGNRNSVTAPYATVGGGLFNSAEGLNATVGGGSANTASGNHTLIGGGTQNAASSIGATVNGGTRNMAENAWATVGGGLSNHAIGYRSVVGGGTGNQAHGSDATIGGGQSNRAIDAFSTVSGGRANLAGDANRNPDAAGFATVCGGQDNMAAGLGATVCGGADNTAAGDFSFAAGHRAKIEADKPGAFVWVDSTEGDFVAVAANEFAVQASGGVRFETAGDAESGVQLAPGGGAWQTLSSRTVKTDIAAADSQAILEALTQLPVPTWRYGSQPGNIRHIGPMAEDFDAAFGFGENPRYLNSADVDGVTLAAVQALYRLAQAQQEQLDLLHAENEILRARLVALEK